MTDEEVKPVTVCPNGKLAEQIAKELWFGPAQDIVDVAEKCTGPKAPDDRELAGSPYDMVNHPQHYKTGKIECIDCISAVVNMYDGEQAYDVGQVIKYLYRAPTKQNFMQDLKKAQWYLNRLIEVASKTNK